MMKGWHKDNYRHSLAAKGYSVKISRRHSLAGVMAQPSYPVEPAPVSKRHIDNVAWDWLKDTGNYMFKENSGISNKNALSDSIQESWKEWLFNPKSKSQEKLVGGVADDVSDEKFIPEELFEGTVVEMEHTKDLEVAKEIAKDHIVENSKPLSEKYDSDYYKKLKQMELQSQKKAMSAKQFNPDEGDIIDLRVGKDGKSRLGQLSGKKNTGYEGFPEIIKFGDETIAREAAADYKAKEPGKHVYFKKTAADEWQVAVQDHKDREMGDEQ